MLYGRGIRRGCMTGGLDRVVWQGIRQGLYDRGIRQGLYVRGIRQGCMTGD